MWSDGLLQGPRAQHSCKENISSVAPTMALVWCPDISQEPPPLPSEPSPAPVLDTVGDQVIVPSVKNHILHQQ